MNIADLREAFEAAFRGCSIAERIEDGGSPGYLQASLPGVDANIHFELLQRQQDGDVFLAFHVERAHYWDYEREVESLTGAFERVGRDVFHTTYYSSQIWRCRRPVKRIEDLAADAAILKDAVKAALAGSAGNASSLAGNLRSDSVAQIGIAKVGIVELLRRELKLPPVQREYCWDVGDLRRLLADLSDWRQHHDGLKYHLGSVILKAKSADANGECHEYEIFDGQQRLTTFALWLSVVRGERVPLLEEKASYSAASRKRIREVWEELRKLRADKDLDKLLAWASEWVDVSVVKIDKKAPADVPFRFFNHVNSSGVRLTDYELLKSHHLRFVDDANSQEAASVGTNWRRLRTETFR